MSCGKTRMRLNDPRFWIIPGKEEIFEPVICLKFIIGSPQGGISERGCLLEILQAIPHAERTENEVIIWILNSAKNN